MPEGDTVWLAARRLDEALGRQLLTSSDFRIPALATVDLGGRTLLDVTPRGKHLLFRLDDDRTLHTHFGMDGSWHLYRPGTPWRGGPGHTIRVVLTTAHWVAVGYRLPVIDLIATGDEASVVGHLGPDLLGPDWDAEEALTRLRARPDREIGDALLDQGNLAGIGNVYKCEALFICGVNPFTPVAQVADLAGVVDTARRLLTRNAARTSQATTGDDRRPHYVHGRGRRPCYRCGTLIVTKEQGIAPMARITYWCPVCQPA
jgi:endonuclease VIII